MPSARQFVVEAPSTERGSGRSSTTALRTAYPGSPIYGGEGTSAGAGDGPRPAYSTDEEVQSFFEGAVIDGVVNDGGQWFGDFNRDYVDAPNLNEVETGGGGLPGSPYAPNVASPPEGQNPADIPAEGVSATEGAQGSGGPFDGDGLASPHSTTVNIADQTIGSLMFGDSDPS